MARIVTVFGATGTQGSSVVDALLADGTFTPRAATRNPDSEASKKLKARGAEVVKCNLWDKESVKQALVGSEGVFGVTNYYDPTIANDKVTGEIDQGKDLIDASKEVGVKFFIWSSLPSSKNLSNGKYPAVHHFENKTIVQEYLKASGLPHATVYTGWFAENTYTFGYLTASSTGYDFTVPRYSPTSTQAILWVEKDLGASVLALLKNYQTRPAEILDQVFAVVTERITYPQYTKILEEALGKPVTFKTVSTSGLEELDQMYDFQSEYGLYPDVPVPDPRLVALGVKFATLKQFAEEVIKPRFA